MIPQDLQDYPGFGSHRNDATDATDAFALLILKNPVNPV